MNMKPNITIISYTKLRNECLGKTPQKQQLFLNDVPFLEGSLRYNDDEKQNFYHMIIQDEKVIASGHLKYFGDHGRDYMCLMSIGVAESERGNGYSSMLIRSIMKQCLLLKKKLKLTSMEDDGRDKLKKNIIAHSRECGLEVILSPVDEPSLTRDEFTAIMNNMTRATELTQKDAYFEKDSLWGMAIALQNLTIEMCDPGELVITEDDNHACIAWNNSFYDHMGEITHMPPHRLVSRKEFMSTALKYSDDDKIQNGIKDASDIIEFVRNNLPSNPSATPI